MPDEENEKADADKLKQRNRELAILNTVAKEMNRSVDLDQALRTPLRLSAFVTGRSAHPEKAHLSQQPGNPACGPPWCLQRPVGHVCGVPHLSACLRAARRQACDAQAGRFQMTGCESPRSAP